MKDLCQKGSIKKVKRELPVAKNLSFFLITALLILFFVVYAK